MVQDLPLHACGTGSNLLALWSQFYQSRLVVLVRTYLLFDAGSINPEACGDGSYLPALWCQFYYSRLVVLDLTYLLSGASSIIPG